MRITILGLALLIPLIADVACGDAEPEKDPVTPTVDGPPVVAPEPGKAILAASCTTCHGADTVEAASMDRDGWAGMVTNCMGENPLPEEKAAVLVDYLVKHHGAE